MKTLFKVITQSEPQPIQKQDGSTTHKSTIVLQEIGGKYENQYVATLLGNAATGKYYPNDLVYASLHFSTHDHNGTHYQDILVQDILKFS